MLAPVKTPVVSSPPASGPAVRTLVVMALPALVVGIVSALVLYALEELASLLEHGLWDALPHAAGIDPSNGWWIFGVLTLTGLAVGLVVKFVPGHGGQDSAATDLIGPPQRVATLPSLALVAVLGLAGGVSLGPESPIIAINSGLLVAVGARFFPRIPGELAMVMAAAGTVGALFGSPIAAALILTGIVAARPTGGALWDRLFLPLVSAGAGSITMTLLARPSFAVSLPAYTSIAPIDLLSGAIVAAVAAAAGVVCVVLFRMLHPLFHGLKNPILYITLGGMVLGILGAIGGEVTLFKGLSQMAELLADRDQYGIGQLVIVILVKFAALAVAAAAGFRGGHIFPAVFIGVAVGILVNVLVPGVPLTLAVACGVLGVVLAISRDGWIALFIAALVSGNVIVIPLLCIAILPAWLIVTKAPEMIVSKDAPQPVPANP
ncbi:MAG: ion channel protein [Herbiconiux sp.]|nr:MAG: ion channel protein [Herbiconiux sp.]